MIYQQTKNIRRGAVVLESAVAYSATFVMVFGLIVGGMGVFRYQEVAALAREAARYASVHGGQYAKETGKPAATSADVYKSAIEPYAVNLDAAKLSYSVTWNSSNMPTVVTTDYSRPKGNTVSVTVTYEWMPELFFLGPITLSSTSTGQVLY
jgi:Flp pilus assembly protein TadG